MKELDGQYFLINGQLQSAADFHPGFLSEGVNVYEVVRHSGGLPLFLEEHIARLNISARAKGLVVKNPVAVYKKSIKELCLTNGHATGNIKIVVHENRPGESLEYIYPVPFSYPTEENYRKGVALITLKESRPDPNLKSWRPEFREKINALKTDQHVYEILLINGEGLVTEGSQSNLFYVRNGEVITARKQNVLPGITREKVIEICHNRKIPLLEKDFGAEELYLAESIFLTGTSPKVLPVFRVDDRHFNTTNPIITEIMLSYDREMEHYIRKNS